MAFSDAEELRIRNIETVLNDLQTAVNDNLASKQQMRQLILIKQSQIEELERRVDSLESQIALLQGSQD